MKVFIDAHMVGERETGNETFVLNLIRGLQSLNTDVQFLLGTTHKSALASQVYLDDQFRPVPLSRAPLRRLLIDMPRVVKQYRPDMVHVTYVGPPRVSCPVICTVHDVAYRRAPEWFSPRDRLVLELGVGVTIRRCAQVMTVSDFSLKEIQEVYKVPDARITRVWAAASELFTPDRIEGEEARRKALAGADPYFLLVGNLQPRKNLLRAIHAYARMRSEHGVTQKLVIVGKDQWRQKELKRLTAQCGLEDQIRFTGYVEPEDLPILYRGADVFLYPSLYEGFGLPVLEAMACGTPVICSNRASLPEVAGDAARYVDPEDVGDMTKAVVDVCRKKESLADLSRRGLERAAKFSWEETARQTLAVYRKTGARASEG